MNAQKKNTRKVIIDCDPGIDDALALMLSAASPELEILGVTVVCGNVPVEQGTKNALKVLEWMGKSSIPVYAGAAAPLVRDYVDAMDTHGADGLGESHYPDADRTSSGTDAVSFLIETLRTTPEVSIIAIGPLTNIARVVLKAPEVLANLDTLVSMGGAYKSHGNCSPVAEYNYWCDPDGAQIVYDAFHRLPALAGKCIHMIGLDVTRKIVLTPNLIEYMKRCNPAAGECIERITRFYFDFHWAQESIIGCVINDPLAVAYFLSPELCDGFFAYTQIETQGLCIGQSVVDAMDFYREAPNSCILTQVDVPGFFTLFLERVLGVAPEDSSPFLAQLLSPPPSFPHETLFCKKEGGH